MRSRRGKIASAILVLWSTFLLLPAMPPAPALAGGEPLPRPQGYVSDYAGVLDAAERARLEELAARLERETTAQLAVVTVRSASPDDPKAYAVRLFEAWGIGQKGKDNGVLILLALDERRVEVEVGYGLESILPDGRVGRILDDHVVPRCREQKYGEGLLAGAAAIAGIVTEESGRRVPPADAATGRPRPSMAGAIIGIALCLGGLWLVLGRLLVPRCPRCRSRLRVQQKIVEAASVATPGRAIRIYDCLRCGFTREKEFRMPRHSPPIVHRWPGGRPGGIGGFGAGGIGGRRFGGFGGGRSGGGGAGRGW